MCESKIFFIHWGSQNFNDFLIQNHITKTLFLVIYLVNLAIYVENIIIHYQFQKSYNNSSYNWVLNIDNCNIYINNLLMVKLTKY